MKALGLRMLVPSVVTGCGHALTLAWLLGAPLWLGIVGLLCDAFDGWCARRLGASSAYGSLYDWTVDVTVCAVVMQRIGALPLALAAVPLQVWLRQTGRHASGRAAASIALASVGIAHHLGLGGSP